jgi:hypothetical protein
VQTNGLRRNSSYENESIYGMCFMPPRVVLADGKTAVLDICDRRGGGTMETDVGTGPPTTTPLTPPEGE